MTYTGTKTLVAGADSIVYTDIDEAIENRNASDYTGRYYAELCDS